LLDHLGFRTPFHVNERRTVGPRSRQAQWPGHQRGVLHARPQNGDVLGQPEAKCRQAFPRFVAGRPRLHEQQLRLTVDIQGRRPAQNGPDCCVQRIGQLGAERREHLG
jgi:hypothetical protein